MASFGQIIERHQQLYENSCSSMAVELVLKLNGMVGGGYRKLQDTYRNTNVGFGPYRNRRLGQLQFVEHGFQPPFVGLTGLLDSEVTAGRFPIISFWSGEVVKGGKKFIYFHEWVVVKREGADFEAVSKHFRETKKCSVNDALAKSPHTNLLTYTIERS